MGHANNIGRVGALAVALGVGWAVASTSGVAYADNTDSSSSSESSSTTKADRSGAPSDTSDAKGGGSADDSTDAHATDDATDDEADDDADADAEVASTGGGGSDAADDDDVASASEADDAATADVADVADDEADEAQPVAATTKTTAPSKTPPKAPSAPATPATPQPAAAKPTLVSVITDVVTALLTPAKPSPATPLQGSTFLASLAAARDELERNALRRAAITTQDIEAQDVGTPNVLVIGVDGTNLSRVLAHPELTTNFFKLIQGSTTAASTIVGHTTISNPSWTSILTGAWGEKTGVINNVFTPWTYDKWPTMFTQLETLNPGASTTSIANWNVISAIAASGLGADTIINVPELENDPRWLEADDLVGEYTEAAIAAASADVANLIFSYFVGVDENGHMFGGDSPEYLEALANFDENLGEIMLAVDNWEALTGEQWTIMMVTDHGHQPQKGFGHGFQSPDETSTFVIANNPLLFTEGGVNLKYSIVDVTPTVMHLFGFEPAEDADGVSLTDLDDSTVLPGDDDALLRKALQDAIAMYGYPDIGTNIALSVRTIAATIPYYVDNIVNGITSGLQSLADQDIFLISPLASLAIIPVKIVGDIAYIATNIVAQIVARLTGVEGASIFPLERPATPTFPWPPEESSTPDLVAVACTDGRVSSALFSCGAAAVAV
ncbi:alkaline phosphatase family protein [Mycobacterium sp. 236(2023)]|uniref:alkaline phosphatase family protein n=1 Tax=Mycobacterium sp. 236(2023) TaxID=3038163 RepID=UPI0024152450|nr:alkaline phosphatase family protein [Mycobacterium sp. 236(2023)]MDG4666989.1 alkaline phosphatase family protein [Mycobacterium sp. 236(2023)]